ncbi:MAG: hypothetical protein H6739_15730 [Alphaproteobacteria bacterium]|nr:hypothetical protein [Alphaproteobacteria bacterium]MCB9761292.1 hypothetical protein [Alphaproteobacteria bacterium]
MILSVLAIAALLQQPALAQDEAPADDREEQPEDPLSPYRLPFDVLTERAIGTSARPVEFNWRRTTVHLAGTGSHLFELNNFNSLRAGGLVRVPSNRMLLEAGVSYVYVWDSPSSELLALTPYRQPGRPQRLEFDVGVALPVAEGVVTVWPRVFPAVELTFNLYAHLRYNFYPMTFSDMKVREIAAAVVSPTLSEDELGDLEERRLNAMQVDLARYGVMVGIGNDLYLRQGLFVSPRAMFALPILAPLTQTEMVFQADLQVVVGVAF